MSKAPWQRPRAWKGGWIEGWCTDLLLQCANVGRAPYYEGDHSPCMDGCVHDQEELHAAKHGCLPTLQRRPDGQCKAWRERAVGGERNHVHDPPASPLPSRFPKTITVDWFLTNGWKGSEVTRRETGRGVEVTLRHPSGATLRIRDDAVGFVP